MIKGLSQWVFMTALAALLAFSLMGAAAHQADAPVDLRIWTETSTGGQVYDICYTLVEYSNLGCDENLDGNVLFQDIPPGRYYVEPSYSNGSDYRVEPFTILVDEYRTDHVAVALQTGGTSTGPVETTDVLLLTRDPETGESLTDVCYELVGYSNIGCDENQDGRVSFADIPYSSLYTIHQTKAPAGYTVMDDVYISLMPMNITGPRTILLSQSKDQAPVNHLNMSVVFYESGTNDLLMDPENCAQLRYQNQNASNVGCDEDIVDGQIDFMHVEIDPDDETFGLRATTMCGYEIVQNPHLQRLWAGEHYLVLYVELEPNGERCN